MNDWMDGYQAPLPPPRPQAAAKPSPVIAPWSPGQQQIPVLALCCPHCGSIDIAQRDNARDQSTVRWECNACSQSFRVPRADHDRITRLHGVAPC